MLPDATTDLPATNNQVDAVRYFYGREFGLITDDQANALLSVREYSRLFSSNVFRKAKSDLQEMLARCVAAFILHDQRKIEFCKRWSDVGFARGYSSRRVTGAPIFAEVEVFAEYLEGALMMEGMSVR